MMIKIEVSSKSIEKAKELLEQTMPSSIKDIYTYFEELSSCLWGIRDEVNEFIDAYPTRNNLPYNFRCDPRFDDGEVSSIENSIENRMEECSSEAKRIEVETVRITIRKLIGE